ncbi:MAG TPA: flagellar biosynthesis repressor FlbT [Alphaproteobacteria bacterium]|nr:flagellar biosynthesis repressor FlbT [Alphaproteobacteria bacterium]HAJ47202.1 flagellar biosynthesis repressor FlbT [Alphaproteobacteria bacterium]
MPLKLSLKPHERFVLNGAVLTNGDRRTHLVLQNKASILREKDILQSDDANTPARRIYFPIMMMYLDPDAATQFYDEFALRMSEFMNAISNREAMDSCIAISKAVMAGQHYKALMLCRKLFDFEQERLNYVCDGVSKSAAC